MYSGCMSVILGGDGESTSEDGTKTSIVLGLFWYPGRDEMFDVGL